MSGHQIEVDTSRWFAGPKLFVDDKRVSPAKPNQFILRRDEGPDITLELRKKILDPVPTVVIDGREQRLVEPFGATHWFLIGLPALIVPFSLLVGAVPIAILVAFASIVINARLFRSNINVFARYGLVLGGFFNAVIIFFALAFLVSLFFLPAG